MNIVKAWLAALGALIICGPLSGVIVLFGPPKDSPDNLVVRAVFVFGPALLTMAAATMLACLIARSTDDHTQRLIAGYGLSALVILGGAVFSIGSGAVSFGDALTTVAVGAGGAALGGTLAEQLYRKRRRARADWY
ncbi:MAG: hypothetical protein GEV11_17255 [Streptosporangiales bacterium]|nr:hypothetical protein [Streptosporangiales bacterium]